MSRYFYNKLEKFVREINTSKKDLNECLTATYQVGTEMVEIDGTMVEQPKYELVWEEITKEQADALNPPMELEYKPTYEQLVEQKLVERGYTPSKIQAIVCNSMIENDAKAEEHAKELAELQKVRNECKAEARAEVNGGKKKV